MKNILIVDDEKVFLQSVSEGLSMYAADFNVLTAENGKKALEVLKRVKIDLVVTDLKMPEMDGFELLTHINNNYPGIPVIVITAFGTSEIGDRVAKLGAIEYLEKPLGFNELAEKIFEGLAAGSKGYIRGITLPSFLQLLEMEQKTCTLTVRLDNKTGNIYFFKGKLINAEAVGKQGEPAIYEMLNWDNPEIEIVTGCQKRKKVINTSLSHLLMEGFRLKDEASRDLNTKDIRSDRTTSKQNISGVAGATEQSVLSNREEVNIMAVQDKLKEFAAIEGFGGVALYTPTGEALAMLASQNSEIDLKAIGVLANNVLMNAQKASLEMGTGRGQFVHIEAEKAHIFVRCLNEGTDPLKSQPGKAHIHLVLVLTDDSSIGLAKMKINSIIASLAPEFR